LRSKTILLVDAALRVVCFGLVGTLALKHHLALGPYLQFLAISSITRSLSAGARRTAIDELIRPEQRLAGNSLLGFSIQLGVDVLGP
jgi:hypothetical protein